MKCRFVSRCGSWRLRSCEGGDKLTLHVYSILAAAAVKVLMGELGVGVE